MKILCLHNIVSWVPDAIDFKSSRINRSRFEAMLETIEKKFELCSFSELETSARSDSERVCLSFDDGFAGVYECALPILKTRGLDAACFISPRIFESGFYYHFQELEAAMRIFGGGQVKLPWSGQVFTWKKDKEKARTLKAIKSELKTMDESEREKAHQAFMNALGVTRNMLNDELNRAQRFKLLTLSNCRDLIASGWTIGAHSLTHRTLSKLSLDQARLEIAQSQIELSDILGIKVDSFAYPYGDHAHISTELSHYARSLFDKVFTTTKDEQMPGRPDLGRWDIKPFMKEFFPEWKWN